jgi:hypothetical protein
MFGGKTVFDNSLKKRLVSNTALHAICMVVVVQVQWLQRSQMSEFFARLTPCVSGIETCFMCNLNMKVAQYTTCGAQYDDQTGA